MALVGLASTVAIEGGRNNIYCNVIVPTAASRLTEDILPPELFTELKPELIAPVVVNKSLKLIFSFISLPLLLFFLLF